MVFENPVQIKLKTKYSRGGKGQLGFKPPSGGGNSAKKRESRSKLSEAQKKALRGTERKRIRVLLATGKVVMQDL